MSGDYEQLAETLARLDVDWKLREEGLAKLQSRLEEGRADAFDFLNTRGAKIIALQLSDLRSGVVRGAAEAVYAACQARLASKQLSLDNFTECLLKEPNTFKALGSGNKLIASHAARALTSLFEARTVPFHALESFLNVARGNKNPQIREKVAQCLSIYAAHPTLPISRRSKPNEMADFFMRAGEVFMRDASANVRNFAKKIKGFTALGEEAVHFADQSKDTADELEPPRHSKAKPRAHPPTAERFTIENFKHLAGEAEGAQSSEQREEARVLLLKADLKPLMPELLRVASQMEIPLHTKLLFLFSHILNYAPTDICAETYLKESSLSSLLFLKSQLSNSRHAISPALYKRIIDALCRTLACRPSSPALLRAHAETLFLLLKRSDFSNIGSSCINLPAALAVLQELGFDTHNRLMYPHALPVESLPCQSTKEITKNVTDQPVLKSMQTIKLSDKYQGENASIGLEINSMPESRKNTHEVDCELSSLYTLLKTFVKCNREDRHQVCDSVTSSYKPSLFYELLERELTITDACTSALVDAMKFAMSVFKHVLTTKEAQNFIEETTFVLDSFVNIIKSYLFSHSEVVVRKTAVQLLVSLYHLIGEKAFEQALYHFAPEQQRLIYVYIKKSLE